LIERTGPRGTFLKSNRMARSGAEPTSCPDYHNMLILLYIFTEKALASNMHIQGAIAVSEIITLRGENIMKKLFTTLTALAFVLGLTASGFTQTTVKEEAKPAVKTQAAAAGSQVTPVSKDKAKGKELANPATKEGDKAKEKKCPTMASKKDNSKKPAASTATTKKEENKNATK
jgi:hypothetical protein